jgi:epoxide hydrolase-like protein
VTSPIAWGVPAIRSGPPPAGWRERTPEYLRELVTYWREAFDWRAREREINAVPQFTVEIGGQRVHFVHVRAGGAGDGPQPLPWC